MSESDETKVNKIGLDKDFITIIDGKLKKIYAILEKVMYDKGDTNNDQWMKKQTDKFGRMLNRNVYGSWYTHELLRELTLLNSYFIIYENKVKHIIKKKEFDNDENTNKLKWEQLLNNEPNNNVGKLFMANISETAFGPTVFEVSKEKADNTKIASIGNNDESKPQSKDNMDTASKITSESFLGLGAILIALTSNSETAIKATTTGAAIGATTISIAVPPFGVGLIALGFLAGKAIQLTHNKTELLYVAEECANIVQECFKMHCANAALLHVFCSDNQSFTVIDTTAVKEKVEKWKGELKNATGILNRINQIRSGGRKTRRYRQQKKRKTARRKSKQANKQTSKYLKN